MRRSPGGVDPLPLRLFLFALSALPASLVAQVTTPTLHVVGSADAIPGQEIEVVIEADIPLGNGAMGWSFGVCSDGAFIECFETELGSDATTIIDFFQSSITPDGFTNAAAPPLSGPTLPTGLGYEIAVARYQVLPTAPLSTPTALQFCDTLVSGSLPTSTVVVIDGASVVPDQVAHLLTVEPTLPPRFRFIAPELAVFVDSDTGLATCEVPLIIDQIETGIGDAAVEAFSMRIAHSSALVEVVSVVPVLPFSAEFIQTQLGGNSSGWGIDVLFDTSGTLTQVFHDETAVVATLETDPMIFAGASGPPLSLGLRWNEFVPGVAIESAIVVGGVSSPPFVTIDGRLDFFVVPPATPFRRGDVNGSGIVDIADGIAILNALFLEGSTGPCPRALDANADDGVDLADAITVLAYLFQGAPPLPAPFPDCGTVPEQLSDPESCPSSPAC